MKNKKPYEVVKSVKSDLDKYFAQFSTYWKETERAWYGDIWENNTKFKPVENHIFRIIENQVAILTDGYPSATAKSLDPEKAPQSRNMSLAIDNVNKKQYLQEMLPIVIRNSHIGGPGYIHEYYDANANDGDGEIKREIVHWEKVLKVKNKCRFEVQRPKEWLKMTYPKYSEEIEKMSGESTKGPEDSNDVLETRDVRGRGKRKRPQPYSDNDLLNLVYTFVKDYSMVKIPEEVTQKEIEKEKQNLEEMIAPDVKKTQNHQDHIVAHIEARIALLEALGLEGDAPFDLVEEAVSQILEESPESGAEEILFRVKLVDNHIEEHKILLEENPNGMMFKYPNNWRMIESIGKTVVYDGKNRYDHGKVPLAEFFCHKDQSEVHVNEIENIIDSQRMQTVMLYKEYKGLQRVSNPNVIIDAETGLTEANWTNEDGQVLVLPQGTGVSYMQPGLVSPQLKQFNQDRMESLLNIPGNNDVSEGKSPHPNASQVTVEKLQLRAVGRQRMKIRGIKNSLRKLMELTYGNIQQFWTTEKFVGVDTSDGFDAQVIYKPVEMKDLDFDIEIDDSSMAGVDKEAFNGLLYGLLNNGHINFQQFLKISDIPKKEEILQMTEESQQMEAMISQLQNENILLKGELNPELLTEEEAQIYEQLVQQMGVNDDQPIPPEGI